MSNFQGTNRVCNPTYAYGCHVADVEFTRTPAHALEKCMATDVTPYRADQVGSHLADRDHGWGVFFAERDSVMHGRYEWTWSRRAAVALHA